MSTLPTHARALRGIALATLLLAPVTGFADEAPKAAEPPWPGSFSLFGSETRVRLGGAVQLDVIRDSGAIATRCDFVTASIATGDAASGAGADGQTSFCVNASRAFIGTRTPTRLGRLETHVSVDFFGSSDTPQLELVLAYGKLSGALFGGDLLIGQAWSTFVAYDAFPDTLDYQGPDSAIGVWQPLVRWTKGLSAGVEIQTALEAPGDGYVEGADLLTRWPDAVGVVKWTRGRGFVRASGIVRDIVASSGESPAQAALGWGVAAAGKVPLPVAGARSSLSFELSHGLGTGAYYDDGPPDGAWNPATSSFELLPVTGFYVGLEHDWSPSLSSTLLLARLSVDNMDFEPGDAFHWTRYSSLNLVWRPDPALKFGVEYLRGRRRDKDGADGIDNRVQITSKLSF